jgi:hypothetical protein
MSLFDFLGAIAADLPGCLSTSIVSLETGLALANVASIHSEDSAGSDAYLALVLQQSADLISSMQIDGPVTSVVVCGDQTTAVSVALGDAGYMWNVVTDSTTTLGFTQAVLRKHTRTAEGLVRSFLDA